MYIAYIATLVISANSVQDENLTLTMIAPRSCICPGSQNSLTLNLLTMYIVRFFPLIPVNFTFWHAMLLLS